jgi:predicted alpha/beta superfamily hydrolase
MIHQAQWMDYHQRHPHGEHSIAGVMRVLPDFRSDSLDNQRDVLVYLPPSYASGDRRYPVIYFQDGQNCFDRATSFAGTEWAVDETLEGLAGEGLEVIAVGLPHAGEARLREYNPFAHVWKGEGETYLNFLLNEVKPVIDRDFRTLPDRPHTGIFGSSMGALISLYAFFRHPYAFGMVGAMSPAFWVGHGAIYRYIEQAYFNDGRIYLDNGTREMSARQMHRLLIQRGYRDEANLRYVTEKGGEHTESAWARRLPEALRFLLRG